MRAAVPEELWREGRDLATVSGRRVKDDGEETQDGKTQDAREEEEVEEDDGSWMVDCGASREGGAGSSSLALTSDL